MNIIYGGLVSTPRNRMDDSRNIAVTRTFNGTVKESLSIHEEPQESLPNNVIKYTASEKLVEINSGYSGGGIDTRMFDVSIIEHTFENGIGTIKFDGGITIIKDSSPGPITGAFYKCTSLISIELPNSVTSIGVNTFYNCSGLTSLTIPSSVTSIGRNAFHGCSSLTSFTIGDSVTSIGQYAFSDCIGLTSIKVENGNTVYDSRDNCNAIIKKETNELIFGCKNTIIPNSVMSIGDYAFSGCNGLTSLTIPNSVTAIGELAFQNCYDLTSITIGNSVTSIGDGAFTACGRLTSVIINNSNVPVINGNLLFANNNLVIYVPAESVDAYKAASGWSTHASKIQAIPE